MRTGHEDSCPQCALECCEFPGDGDTGAAGAGAQMEQEATEEGDEQHMEPVFYQEVINLRGQNEVIVTPS